jgi:serine/threonine protein kinase
MTPYGIGTPPYAAPELSTRSGLYDSKSDVYSFGVILLETFIEEYFNVIHENSYDFMLPLDKSEIQLPDESNEIKQKCQQEIAGLIVMCGQRNANNRPEFVYIVKFLEALAGRLYPQDEKIKKILESKGGKLSYRNIIDIQDNITSWPSPQEMKDHQRQEHMSEVTPLLVRRPTKLSLFTSTDFKGEIDPINSWH